MCPLGYTTGSHIPTSCNGTGYRGLAGEGGGGGEERVKQVNDPVKQTDSGQETIQETREAQRSRSGKTYSE